MSSITETPSKIAAAALAGLDMKKDDKAPSLLSKMQAEQEDTDKLVTAKSMNKGEGRVYTHIEMDDGRMEQHVSTAPRGKFVGDLSITDDSQEPLLQETEQRFVLFPIQYHDVSCRILVLSVLHDGQWRREAKKISISFIIIIIMLDGWKDIQDRRTASM